MPSAIAAWDAREDSILFRGMANAILTNRSTLYALPGLEPFAGNGGDAINKKTKQALKKFGKTIGVSNAGDIVVEEIAKLSGKKAGTSSPKKTPKANGGSPPKRKVKKETEAVEDDEDKASSVAETPTKKRKARKSSEIDEE